MHVSALLHGLAALNPIKELPEHHEYRNESEDDEVVPVTSVPCKWKEPRTRKEKVLKMGDASFVKHVYGTTATPLSSLDSFDPRPPQYRNNASSLLPELLDDIRGKGLCVSLLFDPTVIIENPDLNKKPPSDLEMAEKIQKLRDKLAVTEEMVREVENITRGQRKSPKWVEMRRFRLTSSLFGYVKRLRPSTLPDSLVLQILGAKSIGITAAMQWGIDHEGEAIRLYADYQQAHGHPGLYVCPTGLHLSVHYPFLGASPDGAVYDPLSSDPFGFLEIKCPYSQRHKSPVEACSSSGFCSTLEDNVPRLRHTHLYYSQVQGQMAIGERKWCDFVLSTEKGISVERIPFNLDFWQELLPKLISFWEGCVAPEVVHPVRHLGLPMRDMRHKQVCDNVSHEP